MNNTENNNKFFNKTHFEFEGFDEPWTKLPNTILDEPNISLKALGLYAKIVRYQNSKEHKIYIASLNKQLKEGKDAIRSAIHELISLGYITRSMIRNSNGQSTGYRYTVYAKPIDITRTEPSSEKATSVNATSVVTTRINKIGLKENKKKENKDVDDDAPATDSIKKLFMDYKIQKRLMPQMIKLINTYAEQFSLEVWEHIFVQASEDSVDKKYNYIKKLLECYSEVKIRTASDLEKYNQEYKAKKTEHKKTTPAPKRGFNAYNVDLKERYTPDQLEKVLQDNKPSTGVEPAAIVDEHSWNTLSDSDKLNAYNTKKANGLFIPDFMRDFIDKL